MAKSGTEALRTKGWSPILHNQQRALPAIERADTKMSKPPMSLAVYATWESFSGHACTIDELRSELSQLPLNEVLKACALINLTLRTWEGNIDTDGHEQLVRVLFPPRFADRLNSHARNAVPQRFAFHRLQQLFLMKEAMGCCGEGEVDSLVFSETFARCCLRANDLLHYGLSFDPAHVRIEGLLPEMVTMNDYSGRESILHKVARTRIMLDEVLETATVRQRKEYIDIPKLFSDASGMDVRQYSNLILAVFARYQKLTLAEYARNPTAILLTEANFEGAKVSPAALKNFLEGSSATLAHFRKRLPGQHRTDFTTMRDRPLLAFGDGTCIPLDLGFLADKLENGVFWTVERQALKDNVARDNHHALWGHIFEVYISQLLSDVCSDPPNALYPNPVFQDGSELCDGLVVCGATGVFMEYKASMITAEAKYSGSPEKFVKELRRKFVGTSEKPKGVRQLANSISKYGAKSDAQTAAGIKKLSKIFPLLIAKDGALASPMVNRFLNEEFKQLYDRKKIRPVVTPLFVLSVDELERISPYLSNEPLDEILHAKYIKDPSQSWPFSAIPNETLGKDTPRRNETLERKFATVTDQACLDLFGKAFNSDTDHQ